MNKLIVLALWFVLCSIADALADNTEELSKLPLQAQCEQKAAIVEGGIVARNSDFARKISHADEVMVHRWIEQGRVDEWGNPVAPRESMWVIGWNAMSDDDQALFTDHAFLGWDVADEKIVAELARARKSDPDWTGQVNIYLMPGWVRDTLDNFMQRCMETAAPSREHDVRFIKTASSEKVEPLERMVLRHTGCRHSISPAFKNCMARDPDVEACQAEVRKKYVKCIAVKCEPFTLEDLEL